MKLEHFEADNVEFGRVDFHMTLSGLREVLELGDKINSLVGEDVDFTVAKHYSKRSLNANSYFYVLCGKIADNQGVTKNEVHDREICRYGQYLLDSNDNIVWCLLPANAKTDEVDAVLKPTGKTETRNGVLYEWYALMKPTHLYNSREMAILIDGVVSDAKELGIEVLSEDEIKRMESAYEGGD